MEKTGLYIHIPFCIKKCAYCDFVSYTNCFHMANEYADALILEMEKYRGTEIDTVYIGGGTPTSLDAIVLGRILEAVYKIFSLSADCEITVESNPKTAGEMYYRELKKHGVNRLSIGVQSVCDDELLMLGRVHNAKEALEAIDLAKAAGFENFSVDVMFALPRQTMKSLGFTLDTLLGKNPAHISCYSLIIEEGTPFYDNGIKPLDDDTEREMYSFITNRLAAQGYKRYEISNYAKDGKISHHNAKYWKRVPYIGLGAAAHSFFGGSRYENTADLAEYIENPKKNFNHVTLSKEDEMSEFMFLGLRMTDGVSYSDFRRSFGCDMEKIFPDISKHISYKLLEKADDRLFLTERGIDVSNAILSDFLL